MQLSNNRKRNLCNHKGTEKLLIFLAPKPFLIWTNCKGIIGFVKKIYQVCKHKGDSCVSNYFSIEHIQRSKNSLVDSLTQELTNGDNQSRTPIRKGENPQWYVVDTRMHFSFY